MIRAFALSFSSLSQKLQGSTISGEDPRKFVNIGECSELKLEKIASDYVCLFVKTILSLATNVKNSSINYIFQR